MTQSNPLDRVRVSRINEARNALAARDLATEVREVAGGWAACKPSDPWINRLCGVNEALPEQELDAVVAFYRERGIEPRVEVSSMASEAFLAQLTARGFGVLHFENVFARGIDPGEDCRSLVGPESLERCEIAQTDPDDREACLLHAHIAMSGFVEPGSPGFDAMAETSVAALRLERSRGFVARVGGEPAGACGMELWDVEGERVCGLWGTSVLGPFRRRGVQQALIAHRLAYGQSQGCTLAIIESKPGVATERNAARMGFELAYTRVVLTAPLRAGQ